MKLAQRIVLHSARCSISLSGIPRLVFLTAPLAKLSAAARLYHFMRLR
ncbi:hypothetical protein KCP76_08445 [Salmonella enterica subsp. enterica serovar Weltevreden]|nr:hypothetical protein KCP76_08445 [Salmonella enterica subsp. enterica serovar Weltevreden]